MSTPDRRGFLRDLVGLPLVGGGLSIIGRPSAVAAPVTPGMLATYSAWLAYERRLLMDSCGFDAGGAEFIPCVNPGSSFHVGPGYERAAAGRAAQMRAPLVLAAVGCPPTSAQAERDWARMFPLA